MKIRIPILEYHLVDHCNLNCAGCTHFSPLAKPRFASYGRFVENLRQLERRGFEIGQFNLLGGEPLLHPHLREFLRAAKELLSCVVVLKTNGILLTKDIVELCSEVDVKIVHTDYGVSQIENPLARVTEFFHEFIGDHPKKIDRCTDPTFGGDFSKSCSQLEENGDLHFCGYSANVRHYCSYYKKEIPIRRNEDFFNIYDTKISEGEIWKGFHMKRPFCEWCRTPIRREWHRFDGSDEWSSKR